MKKQGTSNEKAMLTQWQSTEKQWKPMKSNTKGMDSNEQAALSCEKVWKTNEK